MRRSQQCTQTNTKGKFHRWRGPCLELYEVVAHRGCEQLEGPPFGHRLEVVHLGVTLAVDPVVTGHASHILGALVAGKSAVPSWLGLGLRVVRTVREGHLLELLWERHLHFQLTHVALPGLSLHLYMVLHVLPCVAAR